MYHPAGNSLATHTAKVARTRQARYGTPQLRLATGVFQTGAVSREEGAKRATKTFIPVLIASALAATPAVAFDGTDNPGADNRDAGADNALSRTEARAIGRDECSEFKTNFADNKN